MNIIPIEITPHLRWNRLLIPGLMFLLLVWGAVVAQVKADPPKKAIRVLMVGGGASHDFDRWYKGSDVATLSDKDFADVTYTDKTDEVLSYLDKIDVLYLTNNQPFKDAKTREAIMKFAESGKGLVLGHAALWYNWADWPEYNLKLVSGGSRGHDKYGPFDVTAVNKKHPVMKGVPAKFTLKDELYYHKVDPNGAGIEILATAKNEKPEEYPSVFVVKHPHARIVGIALGHDGESHDLKAYQQLLKNAIRWAAK
ncbi:ThuA domain-containing protein [Lunatimonas salinarum]|uniref:ThuA domain-containing protein n=1 Tax=Lunatimonas salinarum TaxID=1774590 RepID=UPI001AE0B547|nr:ThuA domain-containing protein [Lunatimonas salinarum]